MEARLRNHRGPFFYDDISGRFQKRLAYHPERINDPFMDAVAKRLEKGEHRLYPMTSDHYRWGGGIAFTHQGVRCEQLIPMMHDPNKSDGTLADRHIAFYVKNPEAGEVTIRAALEYLIGVENDVYREMYGNAIKHSKAAKLESESQS